MVLILCSAPASSAARTRAPPHACQAGHVDDAHCTSTRLGPSELLSGGVPGHRGVERGKTGEKPSPPPDYRSCQAGRCSLRLKITPSRRSGSAPRSSPAEPAAQGQAGGLLGHTPTIRSATPPRRGARVPPAPADRGSPPPPRPYPRIAAAAALRAPARCPRAPRYAGPLRWPQARSLRALRKGGARVGRG